MPIAITQGLETHYEILGQGPPLLMFAPGGFDASLDKWSTLGVYARTRMLEHLRGAYQCILFDRRETGRSGGRVERLGWGHYVAQAEGLLDHLGIERAHLLGGCMGCCPVTAFAVRHPERVLSMTLYWPVGGARYRIRGQARFALHLAYAEQHGLPAVIELARGTDAGFGQDPRLGPWAPLLRRDAEFAAAYAACDPGRYQLIVAGMARALLDRDTAPGAEPEDLMRLAMPALIVPGRDAAHATSAARYLEECLPGAEYWDVAPAAQSESNVPTRLLEFLGRVRPPG